MNYCKAPNIIAPPWQTIKKGNDEMIGRSYPDGICVCFSIEGFDNSASDTPPMGIGEYAHISISRQNKYPSWDEMRDYIYSCGRFDNKRDVVMLLPPKERYVNLHKNTFHFYQKIT